VRRDLHIPTGSVEAGEVVPRVLQSIGVDQVQGAAGRAVDGAVLGPSWDVHVAVAE